MQRSQSSFPTSLCIQCQRPTLAAFLVALVVGLLSYPASAFAQTTRYVSPTGSDSNPGTELQPFRTIQRAANLVNPGDTVIVEDGIYTGIGTGTSCSSSSSRPVVCLSRGGSATAWVTFKARHTGGARIDGQNNTSTEGFRFLSAANYVRLEGFDVYGMGNATGSASGFELYNGGHDVVIAHNDIHDIGRLCTDTTNGQVGVFVEQPSVRVEGNRIHDIGRFAPNEQGCAPATSYYTNHDHGIYVDGEAAGSGTSGAADATIVNNVFYNTARGWAIQAYPGTLNNLRIIDNTFAFKNPYQDGQIILGANTTDAQIRGNIFYSPRKSAINYYTGSQVNLTVSDNIVYNATMMTTTPAGALVIYNQTVDPLMTNVTVAPFDFHLTSLSPAINAGVAVADVVDDFDGTPRTDGAADIGAYEYVGGMVAVATPTISPDGGTLTGATTVTVSSSTAGATIYYTTDGTTPTTSSAVYSAPLTVASGITIEARASKVGMLDSQVAAAVFQVAAPATIDTVAPVVSFTSPQNGAVVPKNGSLSFTVAASDNVGVVKVVFTVDGRAFATKTAAPFTASYNFRKLASGTHIVGAIAADAAGNTGSATISVVR